MAIADAAFTHGLETPNLFTKLYFPVSWSSIYCTNKHALARSNCHSLCWY